MREVTIGRSQAAITQFRYPTLFVEGPRGTSKSRGILTVLLSRLLKYPGARLGVCRQFRTDLTKTILMTLEEEVFPAFGMAVPGGAHRDNRSEYRLPNGSVIWPFGIDQGAGALSMGVTFIYCAEVLEMTEKTVTDMAGAMRWMRSPENPLLPEYTQIILDENPGAPDHWANQRAESVPNELRHVETREDYERLQQHNYAPAADPVNRWKRIITRHQDNPGYWDHDAWDWTTLGRHYVTQQLGGLTGYQRDRWLKGLHVAAEGNVYPNFSETANVWDDFQIPADWPLWWGTDPGFAHPTATLWFTVSPSDELIVIAESIESGKGVEEHADVARNIEQSNGWTGREIWRGGDPQYAFSQTAHSKVTIAQQWKKCGFNLKPWPRTGDSMDAMVEAVRRRIKDRALIIFRSCRKTIAAVQSWSFATRQDGALRSSGGREVYEEEYKDPNDVIRGIVAMDPKHGRRGKKVVVSGGDGA